MLNHITQSAITILSCQLAWLLIYEDGHLVTASIASDAPGVNEAFQDKVAKHYSKQRLPVTRNDNPLAEVLLRNVPLVGLQTTRLSTIQGGGSLESVLLDSGFDFVTLIPLRDRENLFGVLLFATNTEDTMTSESGQQLIKILRRQAILEMQNRYLEQQLTHSETQRQTEHDFFQMIMKTIGDGMVHATTTGTIIDVSDRLLEITFYTREDLIGKQLSILLNDNSQDTQDQRQFSIPQEIRSKSGQMVPVLMSQIITQDTVLQEPTRVIVFSDLTDLQAHEQVLARQAQQLEALNRASRAINAPVGLQDVIQVILSSAREVLKAAGTYLLLQNTDEDFIVVATDGVQSMHGRLVPLGVGILGGVAQSGQSALIYDVQQSPQFKEELDGAYGFEVHSMLVVPLLSSSEVIGVLAVINRELGTFDAVDLEVLENLAASAAISIENASLFDETRRRLVEISTLLDANAVVTSTIDLQTTLEHICRRLREALSIQRIVLSTINQHTGKMTKLVEVVDATWVLDHGPRLSLSAAPSKDRALRQSQATTTSAAGADLLTADYAELQGRGMKHALNVPMRFKDKIVGLAVFYSEIPLTMQHVKLAEEAIAIWSKDLVAPWEDVTLLCHRILQATGLVWCAIYRTDDEKSSLELVREIGAEVWERDAGPIRDIEASPRVQVVLETTRTQAFTPNELVNTEQKAYFEQVGIGNHLLAPITVQGQVVGVLELLNTDEHFEDHAFSLSQGIANIIGKALENATLYTSLEKRAEALEAAYRELEQADKLKDEMLQNLSHELGTPMTHILGYISLLNDAAFGTLNDEQLEVLQLVIDKTQAMAEMVKHMVALHASNTYNLSLKETHLEQLASLAMRSMTPKARLAGVQIVPKFQPELPTVRVDQVAMSEVFEALLDNAIKFNRRGKTIEISITNTNGPMLEVKVRDEGIGIPESEHEKIFRQFYQVDGSTTRQFGGMGMGLALVQKIVAAHGGKVWVESKVGEGTTIGFTVPKADLSTSASANNHSVFAFN